MPDVIAVLWIALEHAELGPMTIAYETGQGDLGARLRHAMAWAVRWMGMTCGPPVAPPCAAIAASRDE